MTSLGQRGWENHARLVSVKIIPPRSNLELRVKGRHHGRVKELSKNPRLHRRGDRVRWSLERSGPASTQGQELRDHLGLSVEEEVIGPAWRYMAEDRRARELRWSHGFVLHLGDLGGSCLFRRALGLGWNYTRKSAILLPNLV